ncbi:MAG: hypothetical protein K8R21_12910 [Leptospira sp.]|nr:hypothetical protein [Leptospira sp.]
MSHKLGAGIAISIAILITLFEISGEDLPTFRFKEEKAKDYLKAGMIYLNSYQYSTARENFIKHFRKKRILISRGKIWQEPITSAENGLNLSVNWKYSKTSYRGMQSSETRLRFCG